MPTKVTDKNKLIETIDHWYYKKNVNIVPVNWNDKRPNGVNWLPFKNRRIPKELFEFWKKQGLFDQGFAIILGRTYLDDEELYLIGIDCDTRQAIEAFSTINGELKSLDVLSSKFVIERHEDDLNSLHCYFFSPIPFPTKGAEKILGLEVKGNADSSGYMISSPTLHPNGYEWTIIGTNEPPILTKSQAIEMIQHINTICKDHGLEYLDKSIGVLSPQLKNMIKTLNLDGVGEIIIREGERHTKMLSIANSILFNHLQINDKSVDKLKSFFENINKNCCTPEPLLQPEIDSIWTCALDFVKRNKDFRNSAKGSKIENQSKPISLIEQATETILNSNQFVTLQESKEILHYHNGVYVPGGEIIIEKEAERVFGYKLTSNHLTEIKGHIMRKTYHERTDFDKDLDIINLRNGLYSIREDLLIPHSPDYLSLDQKPIIYNPNSKPKLFWEFLKDVLYPIDIRTAIEAMAYTFYRDCPFEYYFKLFGYGSNGKSVFTALITSIHGRENVSNVSVKTLMENRFGLADLEFKSVNIDSEYSDASIKDSSILKKLTGGRKQHTRIERKNQHAYDTYLHAKLFFNANSFNERIEKTNADFRREVIISFPNTFEGKRDDPQLLQKLEKQEEISGLFNILMIALRRILKNKGIYMNEKTIEERRKKSERVADPIKSFLEEAIAEDSLETDYIIKSDFHSVYVRFCKKYKIAHKSIEVFAKELGKRKLYGEKKRTINGERKNVWLGIKLKPQYLLPEAQQVLD